MVARVAQRFATNRVGQHLFFKPSGYTSWLSLRSAEEPFHRAWGFRPVAFGNSIPRRAKRKVPVFCRYLIGCAHSPAICHKSRGAAPFFPNLRVILRGCRFAPLKSPFIGIGAVAPLPSATPYPEGKKKGTCFCRYLIGCGGRI